MKRKIFLTVLITLVLGCMLAIGVSAAAYDETRTTIEYTDINGVTHTVPVVKYDDATASNVASAIKSGDTRQHTCSETGTARVMDNGAYAIVMDESGVLTAYPSWYIMDVVGNENYAEIYEIGYGYLNSASDKTYKDGALRYIEFPEGMTAVRSNSVFGGSKASKYENNVTHMYIPTTVTEIKGDSLSFAPSLKYIYVAEGSQMTKIGDEAMSECPNLVYFQFENLINLTEIDGFRSCKKLSCDVDLSNSKSLKTIGSTTFYETNIGKITLPDSVETIGDKAFTYTNNAYLSSSYLPANLKSIGILFFAYNNNLLDTYIFPKGVTALANEPFQDSKVAGGPEGKELNLVFLGKVTGVVYLNGNGHQKHAEKVSVYFAQNTKAEYNTNGFYIKPSGSSITSVPGAIRAVFCSGTGAGTNGNVTGIEYIYITNTNGSVYTSDMVNDATNGFDFDNHRHFGAQNLTPATCGENGAKGVDCIVCDKTIGEVIPATGDHKYTDDKDCTTASVCDNCHQTVVEALEHIIGTVYAYANGYSNEGLKTVGCTREGCDHGEKTVLDALIVSLGYSKEENGVGITHSVKVYRDAINEYQAYINKETKILYGIIAAIDDGNGTPVTSDGNVAEGYKAVMTENSNTEYTILTVKLCGITDTTQKLNLGAYIIIDGNVNYVYGLAKQTGARAESVSYSDL